FVILRALPRSKRPSRSWGIAMYGYPVGAAAGVRCSQSISVIPASRRVVRVHSVTIAKTCECLSDASFQDLALRKLLLQLCGEPLHLHLEGLPILLGLLRPHVPSRRQDEVML